MGARWRYHELIRPTPLLQGWQGQHFFAWLLMWVNCPISIPHVEGALSVYVKPEDIFVDQGLLRFQAEALDERVCCAGPQRCRATSAAESQALQSHKRCSVAIAHSL